MITALLTVGCMGLGVLIAREALVAKNRLYKAQQTISAMQERTQFYDDNKKDDIETDRIVHDGRTYLPTD